MIAFGQVKIQLLILLIYPIGIIFARVITNHFISNPSFYLFIFFFSHFLALIPLLYYKIRKREAEKEMKIQENFEKENETENPNSSNSEDIKNQLELLKEKIKKDKKKNKIKIFFIVGILYFSAYAFFYYFNYITSTKFYGNISMISEVLYFSLFNKFILGNKMYSHHFFSMILITISILGIYIILIIKHINNNSDYSSLNDFILPTITNFIVYCIFCLCLIKAKSYVEKYFISIYELIIFLGIFCLTLLLLFEPITFLISCDRDVICYKDDHHFAGIITGFKEFHGSNIFFSFGLMIFLFMTSLGLWLTVKILSPLDFLTSDSIITLELNILVDSQNTTYLLINNPFFYIFSIITIFACLVYNEILIINICNLNYNTRNEIIKRQSKDVKSISCELSENYTRSTTTFGEDEASNN